MLTPKRRAFAQECAEADRSELTATLGYLIVRAFWLATFAGYSSAKALLTQDWRAETRANQVAGKLEPGREHSQVRSSVKLVLHELVLFDVPSITSSSRACRSTTQSEAQQPNSGATAALAMPEDVLELEQQVATVPSAITAAARCLWLSSLPVSGRCHTM